MKNIITIQHTQAIHHTNGMIGSWADWDLTELGIEQARRIGEKLSAEIKDTPRIMYSSDLIRARRTAEIAAEFLNIEPIISAELRERNLGEASGKPKEWAKENEIADSDWIDGKPFIGAESLRESWNRLKLFQDKIMETNDENIIIVSHGESLSLFYAIWLGWDIEMLDKYQLLGKSGGVSFLKEDANGKRIIGLLNDLSYKG